VQYVLVDMKFNWSALPKIPKAVVGDSSPTPKYTRAQEIDRELWGYVDKWIDAMDRPFANYHGECLWDKASRVTKPARTFIAKISPPLFIFVLMIVAFRVSPLLAFLIACGIGPTDILRYAGIVGPKKRDKDGKEIDDFF
jgi:hypothetical protein